LVGGPIDRQQSGFILFLEDNREYETLVRMLPAEDQPGLAHETSTPNRIALVQEVMRSLERKLPAYMVPSNIVVLDALPLSANGKVDRKALPIPTSEILSQEEADTYLAPDTEFQKTIIALLQKVLPVEKVGVNDNFFDLGGNSVHLIQFHAHLQKAFGKDIPIAELFKHTTVNELSRYLSQVQGQVQEEADRTIAINEGKNRLKRLLKKSGDESE
jgi:acyl carrier protein